MRTSSFIKTRLRPSPRALIFLSSRHTTRTSAMSSKHPHHPGFKKLEASRPDWDASSTFRYTKTPSPDWKFGDGNNHLDGVASSSSSSSSSSPSENKQKQHIAINPYEEGRPVSFNYKLLTSAIVPRPIALLSTRSSDGRSENLAPFSYFNMINFDPPLFVVGFTGSMAEPKDSLRNVMDTKECVINIVSDHYIEAANATAAAAPFGASEWALSGLTPDRSCETVRAPRVREAVFSVEAKLDSLREWESRATPGKKSGVMCIFEGTRFWVREDALNEDRNLVDISVLRPMARLGGITYQRVSEGIELQRPQFDKDLQEGLEKLQESKK